MLVEDHASFREALAFVFDLEGDFEVVVRAGSLAEARASSEACDFAIVDLALPDGSGVDLIGELLRSNPDVTVLVLSATLDEENVARLVGSGASGVLDKLAGVDEIVEEMRRLKAGAAMPRQRETVDLLRTVVRRRGPGGRDPGGPEAQAGAGLTGCETEVLRVLARGLDGAGVAETLGITPQEEREHVRSIREKLGARSGLQALVIAARRGLVELP